MTLKGRGCLAAVYIFSSQLNVSENKTYFGGVHLSSQVSPPLEVQSK